MAYFPCSDSPGPSHASQNGSEIRVLLIKNVSPKGFEPFFHRGDQAQKIAVFMQIRSLAEKMAGHSPQRSKSKKHDREHCTPCMITRCNVPSIRLDE